MHIYILKKKENREWGKVVFEEIMANHFPDLMKNKFMDPRIIVNCMQGKYNHTKTHESKWWYSKIKERYRKSLFYIKENSDMTADIIRSNKGHYPLKATKTF